MFVATVRLPGNSNTFQLRLESMAEVERLANEVGGRLVRVRLEECGCGTAVLDRPPLRVAQLSHPEVPTYAPQEEPPFSGAPRGLCALHDLAVPMDAVCVDWHGSERAIEWNAPQGFTISNSRRSCQSCKFFDAMYGATP